MRNSSNVLNSLALHQSFNKGHIFYSVVVFNQTVHFKKQETAIVVWFANRDTRLCDRKKMTTLTNSTKKKSNKMIKEIQSVYCAHSHNSSCILTTLPDSHQISEILRKCNNLQRHNSIIWYGNMLTTDDKRKNILWEFQHYLVVYCF